MKKDLLKLIQKTKVDATYAKKGHYNACERYKKWHICLGITVAVSTAIVGTSIFATLSEQPKTELKILAGTISILATVFVSIQTFLNLGKKSEEHRGAADGYLKIKNKAQEIEAKYKSGVYTNTSASEMIAEVRKEHDALTKESPSYSESDYKKARSGVLNKEEEYTEEELNI